MKVALFDLKRACAPRFLELPEDGSRKVVGRDESWPDPFLTREGRGGHLHVWREGGTWKLQRVSAKPNPLYFDEARQQKVSEPLDWRPGVPLFVGREGRTALVLVNEAADLEGLPLAGGKEALAETPKRPFEMVRDATDSFEEREEEAGARLPHATRLQLKILREELPLAIERWLERQGAASDLAQPARSDEELLFDAVAGMLRQTLAAGVDLAVAFVEVDPATQAFRVLNDEPSPLRVFRPSRTVLRHTLEQEPGRARLFHREATSAGGANPWHSIANVSPDWALTLQLKGAGGAGDQRTPLTLRGKRIVLYVDAMGSTRPVAPELLPFLRSVGLQVSSLLEAREQQRRQTQLARYFSPRLRREVVRQEGRLEPAEFLCTVLFCDRRGSSRKAEGAHGGSGLLEKLRENQEVLGRVTQVVFDNDGAVADFAGDAVLGFWGWPPDERAGDHAMLALRTARLVAESLRDLMEMDEDRKLRLPAFRIGISTGRMAVGNVEFAGQMKIGVFGGPVNFGSRLEGLGKMFRVPVIVSEETRAAVEGGGILMRRLCFIRPQGFDRVYPIHELVLPREVGGTGASPEQVRLYEEALDHFVNRRWPECIRRLGTLVSEDDEGAHWLMEQAMAYRSKPPEAAWQGEISMTAK